MNLNELLGKLTAAEESLETEWDPETLVGNVSDKVDSIKFILDKLQAEIVYADEHLKTWQKKVQALKANQERLKQYVTTSMLINDFEALPGKEWRVKLQDSPISVKEMRDPSADDFINHPTFVKRQVSYVWNKPIVTHYAKQGIALPDDLSASIVAVQSKHVRFYPAKKES